MDVIADWLWEVTQALQSEKVYSESEQKKIKKGFHILSFAQQALVQNPHMQHLHTHCTHIVWIIDINLQYSQYHNSNKMTQWHREQQKWWFKAPDPHLKSQDVVPSLSPWNICPALFTL